MARVEPAVPTLTLVPSTIARPGLRFWYQGDPKAMECEGCPVRALCYRLEPGRRYEVKVLRDIQHPCELHDEGRVTVCEVQEVPFQSSVKAGRLRGTAAHWEPVPCGMPECPQYGFCHPVGPVRDTKMEIVSDDGAMECPAGFDLHRVTMKPLE